LVLLLFLRNWFFFLFCIFAEQVQILQRIIKLAMFALVSIKKQIKESSTL